MNRETKRSTGVSRSLHRLGGSACVDGTRIGVVHVLGALRSSQVIVKHVQKFFPTLTGRQIDDALRYAHDLVDRADGAWAVREGPRAARIEEEKRRLEEEQQRLAERSERRRKKGLRSCAECGQPMLPRGRRRIDPEDYRHARGCSAASKTESDATERSWSRLNTRIRRRVEGKKGQEGRR